MRLTYPIKGINPNTTTYISQWFGENPQIYAQFGHKGHNGIDIAALRGTPVYAPHDAWVVENTEKDTGYGLRTTLYFEEDGYGWEVVMGHFKSGSSQFPNIPWNIKNRNYAVKKGELIALVNSTGFSTGDHLHFGVRKYKNGKLLNANNGYGGSIDPKPFMQYPEESTSMKLVNDKGTIYIVAGNTDKRKIGISDPETLGLFGDEPQELMDTSGIPQYQTITKGFIIHDN